MASALFDNIHLPNYDRVILDGQWSGSVNAFAENWRGHKHVTPLHAAAYLGNPKLISALIGRGAHLEDVSGYGDTALLIAVRFGHVAAAKELLRRKASLAAVDFAGRSALHHAAMCGYTSLVWYLLVQRRVDPNVRDAERCTPIHKTSNLQALNTLLDHGADPNAMDLHHRTVLHYACMNGAHAVVRELLLRPGVNVNAQDADGTSPLYEATNRADAELVRLLLSYGANPQLVAPATGLSPIELAAKKTLYDIYPVLISHPPPRPRRTVRRLLSAPSLMLRSSTNTLLTLGRKRTASSSSSSTSSASAASCSWSSTESDDANAARKRQRTHTQPNIYAAVGDENTPPPWEM